LIRKKGDDLVDGLIRAVVANSIINDAPINAEFFLKISCSGGGFGVCRLNKENEIAIREILQDLLKRKASNKPIGLQLVKKIAVREPNNEHPLSPKNQEYFSPCLTLRIDSYGKVVLGQVADQVLKNGTEFIGSFWDRQQEAKFLDKIGMQNVIKLGEALHKSGYAGYFGTDFIQTKTGEYELVIDPNGRLNGNDYSFFARKSLEKVGAKIESTFLTKLILKDTDISSYEERLTKELGPWLYDPEKQIGTIIVPWLKPETLKGESNSRMVDIIYINPKKDRRQFDSFLEHVLKQNK
jgi:hypothetical protein